MAKEIKIPEGYEARIEGNKVIIEPKKSEDERIRKEILEFVRTRGGFKGEWIAWLEKQKERKSTPDWMPKFLDELRSKKNYFDWDEHRDIEGHILAIINWIAPDYFEEKEQKPKDIVAELKHYLATTPKEQLRKDREEIERWYKEHMVQTQDEPSIEQKPAEWSEEDEENFKWFDKFFRAESILVGGRDIPQDKYLWFKSLRPQPKSEWSEEEKDKLNSIERLIVNANAHGNYLIGDKEAIDLQHFIRSIVKPTNNLAEWSEEDEEMLEYIIGDVNDAKQLYTTQEAKDMADKEIAWLQSLLSHPKSSGNWKSSKYMLSLVKKVADGEMLTGVEQMAMGTLHEQLKKL